MTNRTIGLETAEGHPVGRDPRRMTTGELTALGHKRMSPLDALRARCLDCCAGSANEVRLCVSVGCPAWPFRMGSSPWRAPPTDAQLAAARANAARMNASSSVRPRIRTSNAADPSGVP